MTYTGALVNEAPSTDDRRPSYRHDVEGIVVRVVNPSFERRDLPQQVLVFWPGADLVPDLTEWHTSNELVPSNPKITYRADLYGFPILALDTDGYGFVYARNPDGSEQAMVEIEKDSGNAGFRAALHTAVDVWAKEIPQPVIEPRA